jgi:hypothetical protein
MVWDLYGGEYARQTTLRLEAELRDRALQRRASWRFFSHGGGRATRRRNRHDAAQVTPPAGELIPRKAI